MGHTILRIPVQFTSGTLGRVDAKPLEIVCLLAGNGLPDVYVSRLYNMLLRFADRPFRLTCLTDRVRDVPSEVNQIDISGWPNIRPDMRVTQYKLRLFDSETIPFAEFYYIDVTVVLKASLEPIWRFAESRTESLIVINDWHHDTLNSCLLRIRADGTLNIIYDTYLTGKKYDVKINEDQDFIDAVIKEQQMQSRVTYFPDDLIVSYKHLRRMRRKDPKAAQALLDGAPILKFHGLPRPHELLSSRYRIKEVLRSPGHALKDWGYLAREVKEWWQ